MTLEALKELAMEPTHDGIGGTCYAFNEDTFADLIIKECIKVAEEVIQDSGDESRHFLDAMIKDAILEHFGY